jgi:hypothetical protein
MKMSFNIMSSTLKFTPYCELASLYMRQAVKPHTGFIPPYIHRPDRPAVHKQNKMGDEDDVGGGELK